jgi:hypothetical protein
MEEMVSNYIVSTRFQSHFYSVALLALAAAKSSRSSQNGVKARQALEDVIIFDYELLIHLIIFNSYL